MEFISNFSLSLVIGLIVSVIMLYIAEGVFGEAKQEENKSLLKNMFLVPAFIINTFLAYAFIIK